MSAGLAVPARPRLPRFAVAGLLAAGCTAATAWGVVSLGSDAPTGAEPSTAQVQELFERLPVRFEANQGQAPAKVDFLARGPGYTVSLGRDGAVLALRSKKSAGAGSAAVVGMHVVGGNPRPEVSGTNQLAGTSNYLTGTDRRDWHTDVPSFGRVRYAGVYPGVDMVYRGSQKELEYDFIVAPGRDPAKIALGFKGSDGLSITKGGDLLIHADGGAIRQRRPVIFQGNGAARRRVAGHYSLQNGNRRVGFEVGAYDRSKPLVIDPKIEYSTFLGGNNASITGGIGASADFANGIAVDGQGNAYVVGRTDAIAPKPYPTTAGALQATNAGGAQDAFITKLNPAGNGAVYSTYLGGAGSDTANDVAVDSAGKAFVTGSTDSPGFPGTGTSTLQAARGGGQDAYIAVLNPAGNALVYSSYVGGSGTDNATRVDVDPAGAAYLSGTTSPATGTAANPSHTNNFPTTTGAFQTTFGGGTGNTAPSDAFVTKINPAGTALVYSTFLGGTQPDTGASIAVDPAGSAYVTGATRSPGLFDSTAAGMDKTFNSTDPTDSDAYVAKLNPEGSALSYGTYVGGTTFEGAVGIDVDSDGSAYITGETNSTDFPVKNPAQGTNNSAPGPNASDVFVTKLNPTGSDTVYSTYMGSPTYENSTDIAVDSSKNAHISGQTLGSFPIKNPVQVRTGDYDGFLAKLDAGGAVAYSTIYGGGSRDFGRAVAADNSGNAYLAGRTDYYSDDSFPIKSAFQPQNGGFADAFVAKISSSPTTPLVNSMSPRSGPTQGGTRVVLTGVGFTGTSAVRFGGTPAASFTVNSPTQITAVSPSHAAGKVTVTVTTPAGTSPDNPVDLFEYAEGQWKLTGSLNRIHYDQQVRTLPNGKVLIIGGTNSMFGNNIASTESFDPKTGVWSDADDLETPRSSYSVTALDGPACRDANPPAYCGDLLVAGGSANAASGNTALATAETYDAASNTWTNTPGNMAVARSQHTAVLLDGPECRAGSPPAYCGKVLVAGGTTGNVQLSSAELYDPATGQWTATGSMQHTARQTNAVLITKGGIGQVILPGGNGTGRTKVEIYNPATGSWSAAADLNVGRERHSVVLLANGKVLAASGIQPGDPPYLGTPPQAGDSSEIYDPATDAWTLVPDRLEGAARNNHDTAVLPSGKVLLAGGGRGGITSEIFDPATNNWSSAGLLSISKGSGHPQSSSYDTVVISSSQRRFEADSAVCGNNCGKALIAGNTDTRTAELYTPEPKINSVSPSSGGQGSSVRITGQGFTHAVRAVLFGNRPAASFRVDSYGQITAVAPAGAGSVRVTVVNEGGRATSAGSFNLVATPTGPGTGTSAVFPGCPALTANVIRGTAAANTINGTTAADRIFAGTGNDIVDALAGNDCVDLGTGDDRGQGGLGNDRLVAGTGKDRVSGSSGNDNMRGNSGSDRLDGGRGNDRVTGDSGNDTLLGSFGNDVLQGSGGKDRVTGSRGRDRISGGSSGDRISGGSSADRIAGGSGADRITGNSGADRISGNSGNDRISSADSSRDRVNCGSGRDRVVADRRDVVSRNCERVRRR